MPHSEIRGSTGARPSPRLFAACHVLHRLSVPRHSPDALVIELAHAQPQARRRRAWQRTDDRGQRTEALAPDLLVEPACRCICRSSSDRCFGCQGISLRSAGNHVSRRLFAYPCPGPAKTERPGLLHGHDSLHDFREQTTENRDQTSRSIVPRSRSRTRRSRRQRTRPRRTGSRLLSSVVCPLSSEPGGPGPTRTADLTLIRRAL